MGGRVDQTSAGSIVVHRWRTVPRRSRARPRLSQPADQDGRAVPGGRADRRHGTHHLGPARHSARPDHRGREPRRRRRRQHRRQVRRGRRSRRLHHPHHAWRIADHRTGRAQEHRLRPGQGFHAGRPAHRDAAHRFRAPGPAGEIDGRACGLRQGQSGQDQLGLARIRRRAAPPARTVQARNRRQHRARALSRHGADARRHRRRRSPGGRRSDDHEPAAHPIRQAARDRDRRRRTHSETARRADRDGGGLSEAAIAVLARRRGAGRNAARHHRQAQHRVPRKHGASRRRARCWPSSAPRSRSARRRPSATCSPKSSRCGPAW